jgi:hypothetical protein
LSAQALMYFSRSSEARRPLSSERWWWYLVIYFRQHVCYLGALQWQRCVAER